MTQSEAPRYRIVYDGTFIHAVQQAGAGTEIEYTGWPGGRWFAVAGGKGEPHLLPVNEPAKHIFDYYTKHRLEIGFPQHPIDPLTGRFYLPTALFDSRDSRFPATVAEADARDNMPAYHSTSGRPLDYLDRTEAITHGAKFANRIVAPGTRITFLGWPQLGMGLKPANEPAEQVARYFAENGKHPKLPAAPWNLFDDALYLPELNPAVRAATPPPAPPPRVTRPWVMGRKTA